MFALIVVFIAILSVAAVSADELHASRTFIEKAAVYSNATATATATATGGWVSYKQCDSKWGANQLGTCSSDTICTAGCAMSSVAMILTTKGASNNPGQLNSWLKSNGGYSSGCLINWSSVNKFGVVTFIAKEPDASESEICSGLSAGHGLVANVHNGGHWVLLTGCAGNGVFYVNDPYYSTTTYKRSDIVDLAVYH